MTASIFAAVEMAPRDPILGLTESFNADSRSTKVNLGVGVYFDDSGKVPLLTAVKLAEKARLEAMPPRGYQPIDGLPAYNQAVQKLLFGEASAAARGRSRPHYRGARRDRRAQGRCRLPAAAAAGGDGFISDPSWENHRALFETPASRSKPIPTTMRAPAASISPP
jgi:aromatic-amino-acid transaminase